MKPKILSEITSLSLNTATYSGETITPTLINFFFGNNGVGKSTIAKSIKSDYGVTWESGKTSTDYTVLVYNQDFISSNIQNYRNLPGVFTMNEQNIEIQNQIAEKLSLKDELGKKHFQLTNKKNSKDTALEILYTTLQDNCWDKTKKIRETFDTIQKGYKRKAAFTENILKNKTPKEYDLGALIRLYQTAYDPKAKIYDEFKPLTDLSVLDSLSGSDILAKCIVSSTNTPFAEFMKAIHATNWVRQGHEHFSDTPNSQCPYCQQKLPDDFESQITACFDAQYHQDIQKLKNFSDSYRQAANMLFVLLQGNLKDPYPKLILTEYHDKLTILKSTIQQNLQKILDKISEPALPVALENTQPLLIEINSLIAQINEITKENNTVVNAKQQKQNECSNKVWDYLSFVLNDEVSSYKNSYTTLTKESEELQKQINECVLNARKLNSEIRNLNSQIVNTKATIDSMNTLLRDSGFQGFSIREKADISNVYEVVRNDGTIAEHLSEGERNFIAFLYFYHLVKGSESADSEIKGKVVVIDDPVSSMDSNALFIVSSLAREMVEICENNVSLEDEHIQGDFIKQIFILTHNAYFHREITYNKVNRYHYVSFYLISKANNVSTIKLCTQPNPNIPTELENYNPVQNSYAALWDEYKDLRSAIPLLNVIRRILEYYFMQLCGYDGVSLRQRILRDNKDKFVTTDELGKEDYTQYQIASAMLSYISTNSFGLNEGINYVDYCMDPSQCRATFKMIFELMHQDQHYKMMMGTN